MLVKHNNNSISDITSAGQLAQGKMTLISSQTASGSASISFTSGIDSTYPIYKFEFINIHPATDGATFQFNMSTDGGSNYNVVKTSTFFYALHNEAGSSTNLAYTTSRDLAQSTSFQDLGASIGNDNDQNTSGEAFIFSPSSTTFVKHYLVKIGYNDTTDNFINAYIGGYANTIIAVDAVQFKFSSGNIDSGTIKLYGIKGD